MKKSMFSILLPGIFAIFPLAAESSEYSIQINEKLSIGTRRAYECTATIAHLAFMASFNTAPHPSL